jgi:hypothetical protein
MKNIPTFFVDINRFLGFSKIWRLNIKSNITETKRKYEKQRFLVVADMNLIVILSKIVPPPADGELTFWFQVIYLDTFISILLLFSECFAIIDSRLPESNPS